jgi:hypothetical protein
LAPIRRPLIDGLASNDIGGALAACNICSLVSEPAFGDGLGTGEFEATGVLVPLPPPVARDEAVRPPVTLSNSLLRGLFILFVEATPCKPKPVDVGTVTAGALQTVQQHTKRKHLWMRTGIRAYFGCNGM